MRRHAIAALAGLTILVTAVPSAAQYFGRNKVQYERFDFKVHRDASTSTSTTTRKKKRRSRLPHVSRNAGTRGSPSCLRHELRGRQPLIMYAAHPHFQQTNILDGIGEGTGGVTESNRRRVILPFAGGLAETDHVLGHELVHAFQYDMASQVDHPGHGRLARAFRPCRCGLSKGMAEYLSLGPIDSNTAMWVREAALAGRDAVDREARRSRFLPVSIRSCLLGLCRRTFRRPGGWRAAACDRSRRKHCSGARGGARRGRGSADARVARRHQEIIRRRLRDDASRECVRPRADLQETRAPAT